MRAYTASYERAVADSLRIYLWKWVQTATAGKDEDPREIQLAQANLQQFAHYVTGGKGIDPRQIAHLMVEWMAESASTVTHLAPFEPSIRSRNIADPLRFVHCFPKGLWLRARENYETGYREAAENYELGSRQTIMVEQTPEAEARKQQICTQAGISAAARGLLPYAEPFFSRVRSFSLHGEQHKVFSHQSLRARATGAMAAQPSRPNNIDPDTSNLSGRIAFG
jgi:hypothetical protein